ncbi:hypothetical protein U27_02958 [Candidatus Vecturithrix granuli]|uniref:Uncharacterized protein n=1 Tax=Vecturithrix granuli TaxID=1499967 RepID=A0A081BUJ2_VECG1|nr:hypothetical protein U27_02958 [Candidatus Vecturithrix granuli]
MILLTKYGVRAIVNKIESTRFMKGERMSINSMITHQTHYPHIQKVEGVCGGEAVIEGTRSSLAYY